MSHYTVTIILPEKPKDPIHLQEMISTLVAPFDENERVDQYKSYVEPVNENWRDMPSKELSWPYGWLKDDAPDLDLSDSTAVAKYLSERWPDEPHEADEDGLFAWSTYNPQSKWDWWTVGGRWTGFYKLLPGRSGMTGEPGIFDNKADDGCVDMARKGDIDASERRMQTFSVLAEGVWKEPGKMGWFGMSSETDSDQLNFDEWFQRFWDGLDDDAWLAVIDAHI